MTKVSSRRDLLKMVSGLGVFALAGMACSSSDPGDGDGSSDDTDSDDGNGSTSTEAGAAKQNDAAFNGSSAIDASAFAVGSGAFLAGKDYGNPFASGIGTTCAAMGAATEGPCHSNTYLRSDISDGLVGLPTRFELMVVDADCNPVPNAIVEIWYASPAGTYSKAAEEIDDGTGYSGSLSDLNVGFCTGNDSEALASKWLRGYQISGTDGRLTIDSVFPGWYQGRTPHVHFIVTVNGKSYVTSQLIFDETLTTAVYTKHGSYSARGDKDTSNAKDNIASGIGIAAAMMTCVQQSDGALVAYKAITIAT